MVIPLTDDGGWLLRVPCRIPSRDNNHTYCHAGAEASESNQHLHSVAAAIPEPSSVNASAHITRQLTNWCFQHNADVDCECGCDPCTYAVVLVVVGCCVL